ncbi:MAG: ATP-binding protein [Christensenellales bacterium]|jgi:serine/threonine-protein kinase RsbT
MSAPIVLSYQVPGDDFTRAGEASSNIKKALKRLGFPPEVVRKVAIALYEGEINMVIHANGGEITATIHTDRIDMQLVDHGPGIPNIDLAMKAGYSTASNDVRDLGFGAGMGLPNMKKYADDFEISSTIGEGTTISMTVLNVT